MVCDNLTVGANGHLYFAGLDTIELAKEYGTPTYFMDENKIREKCRIYTKTLKECFGDKALPLYASKAFSIKQMYRILSEEHMGIDVVSPGEIYTACAAGFPMERAFFHGNNKSDEEIVYAMDKQIGYFIVDNFDELAAVQAEAAKRGIVQKVLLRVTPGIDPHTHQKISTGNVDSKFGVAMQTGQALEFAKQALSMDSLSLKGFHCHVGSQLFDIEPLREAGRTMVQFTAQVRDRFGYTAELIDLGGGLGVRYVDSDPEIDLAASIREIADVVKAECAALHLDVPAILMEPGRSIVADAGLTLYTVGSKKEISGIKNYVSIDGGMTDNPRYTLYSSDYTVINAGKMHEKADYVCSVAGKCCESGDLIQEGVHIVTPERGDILAVCTTGAYNYSMSSNYNAIPRPPVVMIRDAKAYVAVERETFDDMICCQK
ncbi:MAG: diaminopimelate decarboxylase [Oscillospiraceae bacterium]|nr:diaminopimelate decarboxylase [Oscillospiraceae bacterium]